MLKCFLNLSVIYLSALFGKNYNQLLCMLFTAAGMKTWFDSLRTKYGKLSAVKSGDGARELTFRDKWVLDKFAFLKRHIVRVPSRQACGVSIFTNYITTIYWIQSSTASLLVNFFL